MKNTLGKQHDLIQESLYVEFKEFCLQEETEVDYSIVKTGIITNKEKFNNDIYKNIRIYFYKYLPKYISAFINSNIKGQLIIGVNDFGEVTGIPINHSYTFLH